MRALVTGISGFVGTHLAELLEKEGWRVSGVDLRPAARTIDFHPADICDQAALTRILSEVRPDAVFHLAGVLKSEDVNVFYNRHVLGTIALFEAIRKSKISPPLTLIASSSAVYGAGRGAKPITESFSLRPMTHYAISKSAQEMISRHYHQSFGLPVIILRAFNLLGPRLSPDMACSAFARQIALAEAGGPRVIMTGQLQSRRDFIDVRDAVRAYGLAAERGRIGSVYNVCSGKAVKIQECLDKLTANSKVSLKIEYTPTRLQKNDVPVQVGSARRLQNRTGWKPKIKLEQSLLDLLEDWRSRVRAGMVQ